ncbi:hypothetical protein [Helicobacter sp. L8]|uniref:primosomal protein N' family DNA-binding protein n=1 Tax=Helicobacter sp. L8 TaxID=2316078 RepID=UPI001F09D186|nr:hypothetical protein [Helicobacter sp. L8]
MFYTIIPFANTKPLIYAGAPNLAPGTLVKIPLQKRHILGVVLEACARPDFACKLATPTGHYLNAHQMLLLRFIAHYYCAQLGTIAPLFYPFKQAHTSPPPNNRLFCKCKPNPKPYSLEIRAVAKHTSIGI